MTDRHFDLPRYLAILPQFKTLQSAQLQRLAEGCQLRRVARGQMVFRVGDPCPEFHVTVTGQVKLFALSAAGQEKVIELAGPGMSFAEATLFLGGPHRVNAQALMDTLLLAVNRQVLLDEIARNPCFALHMLDGLSRHLHGLMDDVQAYTLHSGLRRVVDYLLREFAVGCAGAATVALPVSKATIALRLSLTPEYFSRVLHQLEGAGMIQVDKRMIRIPDLARLRRHGESAGDASVTSLPVRSKADTRAQRHMPPHMSAAAHAML